jgi:sulfur dioxygenase
MTSPIKPVQLFDAASSTFTYILFDNETREAVIIDPVDDQLNRDLETLKRLSLKLLYVVETHAHADHITSAATLIEMTGAQAATPSGCGIKPSAIQLDDQHQLKFGAHTLTALHTPGHTAGSMSFSIDQHVFTGDTLLIGGCGRTDFQSGNPEALFDSVTQVLFKLSDNTVLWPGHDYKGQTSSTIGQEKSSNARFTSNGVLRSKREFVEMMNGLNLPKPKRMDEAVPANLSLGVHHEARPINQAAQPVLVTEGYAGDVTPELAYHWWESGLATLIDIRTNAERAWVGFVPDALCIEWKSWPTMDINPNFEEQLISSVKKGTKVVMLCRSSLRSIPAAQKAQTLGYEAYNILEGFEGDPDSNAHRGNKGGWKLRNLPWRQN